jgi:hypothetical protein
MKINYGDDEPSLYANGVSSLQVKPLGSKFNVMGSIDDLLVLLSYGSTPRQLTQILLVLIVFGIRYSLVAKCKYQNHKN